MSDASKVVKTWIKAIGKGPVESTMHLLSPKLDWQENGLSHEESLALHPRPKWQGVHSKKFKYSSKVVSADDRTVVMEFTATHAGEEHHYCGIFKVSRGKITSAHWYGDMGRKSEMVKLAVSA